MDKKIEMLAQIDGNTIIFMGKGGQVIAWGIDEKYIDIYQGIAKAVNGCYGMTNPKEEIAALRLQLEDTTQDRIDADSDRLDALQDLVDSIDIEIEERTHSIAREYTIKSAEHEFKGETLREAIDAAISNTNPSDYDRENELYRQGKLAGEPVSKTK